MDPSSRPPALQGCGTVTPPPDRDGDGVPDNQDACPDQGFYWDNGCPPQPAKSYVALGDSVASGEGINYGWQWQPGGAGAGSWHLGGSYTPTWYGTNQNCHQSDQAYPFDVAGDLHLDLTELACTGASAHEGVLQAGANGPAQLRPPAYDTAHPDLVSLTLGADDVHFDQIVKDCYFSASLLTAILTSPPRFNSSDRVSRMF